MAALSALLKTWVLLQTLCLALAQVVSGQGRLRPALLRFSSFILGVSGDKGPCALDFLRWCYSLCAVLVLVEAIKMLEVESTQIYSRRPSGFIACMHKRDELEMGFLLQRQNEIGLSSVDYHPYCLWTLFQGCAVTWGTFFMAKKIFINGRMEETFFSF